jgi:hypothetical protein
MVKYEVEERLFVVTFDQDAIDVINISYRYYFSEGVCAVARPSTADTRTH